MRPVPGFLQLRARRGRRVLVGAVALLAILMATLAPSVSRLMASYRGIGGFDGELVCSVSDLPSRTSAPEAPPDTHAFDHCPYCGLHTDLAPPPAARSAGLSLRLVSVDLPAAFPSAPRMPWIWSAAQPRAPPSRT